MSKRLSQLYGVDIYSDKAEYVGKVQDVILNLEDGEVMRLSLKSFKANTLPRDDVRKILQEESIGYHDIIKVGDIIICNQNAVRESKKVRKKIKG